MNTLVVGKELGGQIMWASEIENYPGFTKIENYDLISRFQSQVSGLGVKIVTAEVDEIRKVKGYFEVISSNQTYQAKTIILCLGLIPRRLNVPGEAEFQGKGVSYCANCDGPFYKGKPVAVVGGGNSALDAAEVLSKIASQVYLVHRRAKYRAFEALVKEVEERPNIEEVLDSQIKEITGNGNVKKIIVEKREQPGQREIEVAGVFVEIGRKAGTDWLGGLVNRDKAGQIIVDEYCATSQEGVFAAGDATQVPFKQITIATGQATIAALSAYQYLQTGQVRI
jgi:thioredoxin-disulfide reductase